MDYEFEKQIQDLCSQIVAEQDRERFRQLVEQLNRLLSSRGKPFQIEKPDSPEGS
jgi:hypothetical protein